MSNKIQIARKLAAKAHEGQFRRDARHSHALRGEGKTPYITHPEAVAALVARNGGNEDMIAVAWLHDVIEDTDMALSDIPMELGHPVINALDRITRKPGETYDDYIDQLVSCPIAVAVKVADMVHNLSDSPTQSQREKYHRELARIAVLLGL